MELERRAKFFIGLPATHGDEFLKDFSLEFFSPAFTWTKVLYVKIFLDNGKKILTVSGHSDGQALLESAVLTAVAIQSYNKTLSVSQAPVLDLLLYAASEEAL